jgi:hypothetical protein
LKFDLVAVVAEETRLLSMIRGLPRHRPVALGQGWSLVPITRALQVTTAGAGNLAFAGLRHLNATLTERILAASQEGPIAYVEADFNGGIGGQCAAVWSQGELVLGPLRCNHTDRSVPIISEWPINRILRHLGVHATPGRDEFDTLRLGRFRTTEAWADVHVEDRGRRLTSVA